ncbi:MAG TPA: TOBE domain-containing protein [Vicinamibacterales bacterium]|jgi:molybdopterin-binding protein
MKISARNTFSGKVTAMSVGPVSTEVTIRIAPNLKVVSVITTNSAKKLKLRVGSKAYAIVKSDNVIVGTD